MKALEKARVTFEDDAATANLSLQISGKDEELEVRIPCRELDWQILSVEQVCTSYLPPLPILEDLYIYENTHWRQHSQGNIESTLWLELLHPFTSVKNLYLSEYIMRRIVPALQELVGGRTTEVLPTPRKIFLEEVQQSGPVQEDIQPHSGLNSQPNPATNSRATYTIPLSCVSRSLPCDRPPVAL